GSLDELMKNWATPTYDMGVGLGERTIPWRLSSFPTIINEELQAIKAQIGEEIFNTGNYIQAAKMLEEQTLSDTYTEFLTLPAYATLV
ncbi:MAG: hypothetical protein ACKO96_37895, partial [Flammeovirgaceae bacterium]